MPVNVGRAPQALAEHADDGGALSRSTGRVTAPSMAGRRGSFSFVRILRASLTALGVMLGVWLAPDSAWAVEIRVRGPSTVSIAEVSREGSSVRVVGSIQDDRGEAIGKAAVTVLAGERAIARGAASAAGRFEVTIPLRELAGATGGLVLRAEWPGDSRYGASRAEIPFDPQRGNLRLAVVVSPASVPAGAPPPSILVEASSGGPVADLAVEVRVGDSPAETAVTDAAGFARLLAPEAALQRPGELEITAQIAPSAAFSAASARAELLVMARSEVSLAAQDGTLGDVPGTLLRGALKITDQPLGPHAIAIVAGERVIATAVTDEDGAFEVFLTPSTSDLAQAGRVRAIFSPASRFIEPAVSDEIVLPGADFGARARLPYLMLVLGVFLFWAAGRGIVWLRAAFPTHRRRLGEVSPAVGAPQPQQAPGGHDPSVLAGRVIDDLVERPVPRAHITLSGAAATQSKVTGADGVFTFPLPVGPAELAVEAPGYASSRVPVAGHSVSVRLTPLRAHALARFRAALDPLWADGYPWGLVTPQQAMSRLLERRRSRVDASRALILWFQRAYFSGAPLQERDLDELDELLERAFTPGEPREGGEGLR